MRCLGRPVKISKQGVIILSGLALCALIAAAFVLPLLAPAFHVGVSDFTIYIHGAPEIDFHGIRYLPLSKGTHVEWMVDISDEEFKAMSLEAKRTTPDSVRIPAGHCLKAGPLTRSRYTQDYAVLLLIPQHDGPLIRRVVILPDLRKSKSASVDLGKPGP